MQKLIITILIVILFTLAGILFNMRAINTMLSSYDTICTTYTD